MLALAGAMFLNSCSSGGAETNTADAAAQQAEIEAAKAAAQAEVAAEASLGGVTERRKPEWIMNMIINPEEMTKKDPTGQELLAEHLTQMTNQNLNEEDARKLLEYFRQNDGVK